MNYKDIFQDYKYTYVYRCSNQISRIKRLFSIDFKFDHIPNKISFSISSVDLDFTMEDQIIKNSHKDYGLVSISKEFIQNSNFEDISLFLSYTANPAFFFNDAINSNNDVLFKKNF